MEEALLQPSVPCPRQRRPAIGYRHARFPLGVSKRHRRVRSQQADNMEEHGVGRLIEHGFGVVGEDVVQVHRPAVHERRF